MAQWICLCLPSRCPGFESQAHHLRFHQFVELCSVEKTIVNKKRPGLALKKTFTYLMIVFRFKSEQPGCILLHLEQGRRVHHLRLQLLVGRGVHLGRRHTRPYRERAVDPGPGRTERHGQDQRVSPAPGLFIFLTKRTVSGLFSVYFGLCHNNHYKFLQQYNVKRSSSRIW